jgi:putative phosphoribosyl transferase
MLFRDRVDAGRRLGFALQRLRDEAPIVLGLPRGGVPVAFEVARSLAAPLDVLVVRKLGVPFQPELAMGAVGEGGVKVLNERVVGEDQISDEEISAVEQREREVVDRRVGRFRAGSPPVSLRGRTALIIDDGIATGATARAACLVARARGAARVVLAVPVGPPGIADRLKDVADEVTCLETPSVFFAIGEFYRDFSQTSDEEVAGLLARAAAFLDGEPEPPMPAATTSVGFEEDVRVSIGPVTVQGHLTVPTGARSVVVFAHGSGSSRHSPRNRYVAGVLNQAGLGTLLFDLLTPEEEQDRANVFDVEMLARRLLDVTGWLRAQPAAAGRSVGYFGASTGAAAALWAAATPGSAVNAVVSRGGRPDLAGPRLGQVRAPTLLIVGERDEVVLDLTRRALTQLRSEAKLSVVPGATHLFEEPGTLPVAAERARDWFVTHLTASSRTAV